MAQPGSDSVLGNLLARRNRLSAARQKLGLEAPQSAGIKGNLRPAGVPARTPTQPGAAPTQPAVRPAARPTAPTRPAAQQATPAAPTDDRRAKMLSKAADFLGQVQQTPAPQPGQTRGQRALGRARQLLGGF